MAILRLVTLVLAAYAASFGPAASAAQAFEGVRFCQERMMLVAGDDMSDPGSATQDARTAPCLGACAILPVAPALSLSTSADAHVACEFAADARTVPFRLERPPQGSPPLKG